MKMISEIEIANRSDVAFTPSNKNTERIPSAPSASQLAVPGTSENLVDQAVHQCPPTKADGCKFIS